jgi:tRNA(Ile)-lysidine synthase
LLDLRRDDLRAHLTRIGQDWLDDPMNDEDAFDRVKVRKAREALADAGLTTARIAAAAAHLARAREALEIVTEAVLARAVRPVPGGLLLDPKALAAAPREVALRALAAVLMAVSGRPYRPRFEALERLLAAVAAGRAATLHGCHMAPAPKLGAVFGAPALLVARENPRKAKTSAKSGQFRA